MPRLCAATPASPSAATASAISWVRWMKSSDLATKSVSHLSSTMPTVPTSAATATAPWAFSRPERSSALARPFSRSSFLAASMSPPVSVSAFLASIMPAPVAWRRACTSLAVKSAIVAQDSWVSVGVISEVGRLGGGGLGAGRLGGGGVGGPGLGLGDLGERRLGEGLLADRGDRRGARAGGDAGLALLRLEQGLATGLGLLGGDPGLVVGRRGGRDRALASDAMCWPSSTASAMTRHSRVPERMASSLPGIT